MKSREGQLVLRFLLDSVVSWHLYIPVYMHKNKQNHKLVFVKNRRLNQIKNSSDGDFFGRLSSHVYCRNRRSIGFSIISNRALFPNMGSFGRDKIIFIRTKFQIKKNRNMINFCSFESQLLVVYYLWLWIHYSILFPQNLAETLKLFSMGSGLAVF